MPGKENTTPSQEYIACEPRKVILTVGACGDYLRLDKNAYDHGIRNLGDSCKFIGYNGQETVLFNYFDGSDFPLDVLLKLLDPHDHMVPTHKSPTRWCPRTIFILSLTHPNKWYPHATDAQMQTLQRRITEIHWSSPNNELISMKQTPYETSKEVAVYGVTHKDIEYTQDKPKVWENFWKLHQATPQTKNHAQKKRKRSGNDSKSRVCYFDDTDDDDEYYHHRMPPGIATNSWSTAAPAATPSTRTTQRQITSQTPRKHIVQEAASAQ
jgi:hypothetical protein